MKSYKKWSAKERLESLKKTKQAIKDWIIPEAKKLWCKRCWQTEGIIEYHNEDYSDPIKFLEPLCFRCHIIHHSKFRAPEACKIYWEEIKKWKKYPPVFKRDMSIFLKEHNIK